MDPDLESIFGKSMARDVVSLFGLTAHLAAPLPLDSIESDDDEPEPDDDDDDDDDDEPKRRRLIDQPSNTMLNFGTRDGRRERANFFLENYAIRHAHYPVIKACTWAGGNKVWSDTWLGITWVALQSTDTLCVVVRNNHLLHLERELVRSRDDTYGTMYFRKLFWNLIVSEVEGIEERLFGVSCMRPFSVVTVGAIGEGISGHEDSNEAMYRAEQTSMFLHKKLESGPSLSSEKTVQTAMLATQHLFAREFEAHEIRVFVWEKNNIIGKEMLQKRENPDLEDVLASLSESDNDDPDTLSFKSRRLGASRSYASIKDTLNC